MDGSGIDKALSQIYGPNAVLHILDKAIARALRALYLLDSCLSTKLLEILDHEEFDECLVKSEAADITALQILIIKTLDDESGKCHNAAT